MERAGLLDLGTGTMVVYVGVCAIVCESNDMRAPGELLTRSEEREDEDGDPGRAVREGKSDTLRPPAIIHRRKAASPIEIC